MRALLPVQQRADLRLVPVLFPHNDGADVLLRHNLPRDGGEPEVSACHLHHAADAGRPVGGSDRGEVRAAAAEVQPHLAHLGRHLAHVHHRDDPVGNTTSDHGLHPGDGRASKFYKHARIYTTYSTFSAAIVYRLSDLVASDLAQFPHPSDLLVHQRGVQDGYGPFYHH